MQFPVLAPETCTAVSALKHNCQVVNGLMHMESIEYTSCQLETTIDVNTCTELQP